MRREFIPSISARADFSRSDALREVGDQTLTDTTSRMQFEGMLSASANALVQGVGLKNQSIRDNNSPPRCSHKKDRSSVRRRSARRQIPVSLPPHTQDHEDCQDQLEPMRACERNLPKPSQAVVIVNANRGRSHRWVATSKCLIHQSVRLTNAGDPGE